MKGSPSSLFEMRTKLSNFNSATHSWKLRSSVLFEKLPPCFPGTPSFPVLVKSTSHLMHYWDPLVRCFAPITWLGETVPTRPSTAVFGCRYCVFWNQCLMGHGKGVSPSHAHLGLTCQGFLPQHIIRKGTPASIPANKHNKYKAQIYEN